MASFLKNTIAISDLEGFDINKYICTGICNQENCSCTLDNTNLIICGDIMDSTVSPNPKEVASLELLTTEKIFNLRNIMRIVDDPDIILTLGNRDINKIKCLLLNKLENPDKSDLINRFNMGHMNFKEYDNIIKLQNLKWSESINNWPIFWANREADEIKYNSDPFFLKRFKEIFTDSMGAGNMLNTIYLELQQMEDIIITKKNKLSSDYNYFNFNFNPDDGKVLDDHKAFIIFIIFNRMLHNPNLTLSTIYNTNPFHGLLYKLYSRDNTKLCHYENIDNNIYIYSHGGLTKRLLDTEKINSNLKIIIDNLEEFSERIETNSPKLFSNKIKSIPENELTLEKKINYINNFYKEIIIKIFNSRDIKNYIQFLLALSAPTKCVENINKGTKCNVDEFNTELQSPILAGFRNMRKDVYYETGKTIYQIFGHQPVGFAATIDLFTENNAKTYLINLDSTNSFTGTKFNKGNSESIFKIIGGVPSIKSKFNIDIDIDIDIDEDKKSFKTYDPNHHTYYLLKIIEEKTQLVVEGEKKLVIKRKTPLGKNYISKDISLRDESILIEKNISEFDDILTKVTKLNQNNTDFVINFHGYSNSFFYFTITNSGIDAEGKFNLVESFNKSFYILNIKDMNSFFEVPPLSHQSRSVKGIQDSLKSRRVKGPKFAPKSNDNSKPSPKSFLKIDNYEQKYLKYKQKYMKLKQELNLI
jgi:hypothetical protein